MNRWMLGMTAAVLVVTGAAVAGAGHGGMNAKAMDQNADGNVSKAEITSATLANAAALDLNKDGAVTAEEMQAFHEAKRAERQAAHLARLDANQDGKVSVEEIAAMRVEHMMKADSDGDGQLSADELQQRGHRGRHGGHGRHHGG